MPIQVRISRVLALASLALVFSLAAQAGATRTFVATTGNDSNSSVNCGATTPCRTFGVALSVTNSGGELVVLNSGGYGPATIAQAVIITAIGVDASISVTTGANGLTINTPGNVTITGLNLHGEAAGLNGIEVQQVGFLRVYNMLIENFTNNGVDLPVAGKLAIYDSAINDNGNGGLVLNNVSAFAYVRNTSFENDNGGVSVIAGQATVADSTANFNSTGAFSSSGGSLVVVNSRASFNGVGFGSAGGGSLYYASCVVANNTNAYNVVSGSTLAGSNPGTSLLPPGQATVGTPSTAVVLQ